MAFVISVLEAYFVYTDERSQKSSKLEILLVVEEGKQPGWFCKQMPEGGWNPKATLDQVTDAKHPNEALEKRFFPSETTNSEKGKAKTSTEVLIFDFEQFTTHSADTM